MDSILSIIVSGIVLGSLYAAMAAGLSLIWSTLGIFNFTHGVFMTLGAYVSWQVGSDYGFGLGPLIGLASGVAILVGLGCLIEITLVHPLLKKPNPMMLAVITTLSAGTFLENSTLLIWGPRLKQLEPLVNGQISLLGVAISRHEGLIIIISPTILFLLWIFLKKTRMGSAIRAVGQNYDSALLVGVNAPLLYVISFALSAGLASFAGILLGSIRFVTPNMANDPLLKALIVAIFGGLGSITGTIGGAYVIGLFEAASIYLFGFYLTPVLLFIAMISVLIFRPTGLFGGRRS